jgi:hypothetical protein
MATRLRARHQDEIRTKISTSQLINVLENHALGITEEMPSSRLKAIEILLNKTLPNLQSTEISGIGDEGEIIHKIEGEIVDSQNTSTT